MITVRDMIMEGKKLRIATGVAGAGIGTAGLMAGRTGQVAEEEFGRKLKELEDLDTGAIGKGHQWLTGVKLSDIGKNSPEGVELEKGRLGGKFLKELGYGGAGLGAAILGGAVVKHLLSKRNENKK